MASLGINPAVGYGGPATLEAFLFDFSGDLYGARLTIEFVKKLREERKYDGPEALKRAIAGDARDAREYFANHG